MSNTSKSGKSLPETIATATDTATGEVKDALHKISDHAGRPDPINLDPHGKAADFSLKPDPKGTHDLIGRTTSGSPTQAASDAGDLAGTVRDKAAALADDVQSRLNDAADAGLARASDAADRAKTWVSGIHQEHMQRIDDAVVRGSDGLNRGRSAVEQFVTENPLLVGVVGVAAGLLLGALLPRTRQEDRNLGPYADEVRDQGLRYAREFTSRGRDFVETALDPDNIQAAAQKAASSGTDRQVGDRAGHRL